MIRVRRPHRAAAEAPRTLLARVRRSPLALLALLLAGLLCIPAQAVAAPAGTGTASTTTAAASGTAPDDGPKLPGGAGKSGAPGGAKGPGDGSNPPGGGKPGGTKLPVKSSNLDGEVERDGERSKARRGGRVPGAPRPGLRPLPPWHTAAPSGTGPVAGPQPGTGPAGCPADSRPSSRSVVTCVFRC